MSWIGWMVIGILTLNLAFFGTLFLVYKIDKRRERK